MGAVAMIGAVFYFWKFVSRRSALLLVGFLAFGILTYATRADPSRACDGRTWFCDLIPKETLAGEPEPEGPPPCPDAEPITTRIFQSSAANTEVHRLIQSGVCQQDAIEKVASGWNAQYDPEYGSWLRRLFF